MLHLPPNRWQAFAIHLAISGFIFLCLLSVIMCIWFPGVFMQMGGWQGVKIVASVDLVLGPLLTLIIYNREKKEIKFDLAIIAGIQFVCLAAGIWLVEKERPVASILVANDVYVLSQADLDAYIPDNSHSFQRGLLDKGVVPYYLNLPPDINEAMAIAGISEFVEGKPAWSREDLLLPVPESGVAMSEFSWRQLKQTDASCFLAVLENKHLQDMQVCIDSRIDIQSLRAIPEGGG